MMPMFAINIYANRPISRYRNETVNSVGMVEAESLEDAESRGEMIACKILPERDGWRDHHVAACPDTYVVDPDNPKLTLTED